MCERMQLAVSAEELKQRFNATFAAEKHYQVKEFYRCFTAPICPVITNDKPNELQLFRWGYIDDSWNGWQSSCPYERAENEFASIMHQRCLIPVTGFYNRYKCNKRVYNHIFEVPDSPIFCLPGLWENQINRKTGECTQRFLILTVDKGICSEERDFFNLYMPIIMKHERAWLETGQLTFSKEFNVERVENSTFRKFP